MISQQVGLVLSFLLFLQTAAFTLTPPSSVYVADQFQVNWTWLTSEPTSVVVVLNDVSKASDCPTDTSKREGSYVILDLVNRAGSLGFYVKNEATYQTCAFSYTPNAVAPVTAVQSLLAKSNTFKSTVFGTTVTVQPTSTATLPPPPNSANVTETASIAGPVLGGVIGGIVFLILVIWLIFFKMRKKYQFIRLPPDDHSGTPSSDPLLMNTVTPTVPDSIGHIHPGVSPFPQSTMSGSTSVTDLSPPTTASLKGRFREKLEGSGSTGASGSAAAPGTNSRSGTPVQALRGQGYGHKSRPSTDTRDGSGTGTGSGHASDAVIMSTPVREGKSRAVLNR
ncbi:hypothetical protein E1B28_005329 [Marasmius oreades]|uniref:Uncharacterized protein n=1 Tax=Marasmius oreades TaxID=181124 RepID=A0A9P8ADW2_9AGAR|nr:uncharacterized protein E1B28_005329 [Marasmius oreades]KAG7098024.1 hypothetical protein E1B28_005329 [Marasmius oreades]